MKRIIMYAAAGMMLLSLSAAVFGEGNPERKRPQISLLVPEESYISPANQDGVQDSLLMPIAAKVFKNRIVKGYRLRIRDHLGNEVRVIQKLNVNKRKVFLLQSVRNKYGIDIPAVEMWDGRDNEGNFVPDGFYSYYIETWDNFMIKAASPFKGVVVDTVPPNVRVTIPFHIFSPNGDQRLDQLAVIQEKSTNQEFWKGDFIDSGGEIVKTFSWEGLAETFQWNGDDEQGEAAPDGVYSYRISSRDLAGNSFEMVQEGIHIDTVPTPIVIHVSYDRFSPNNDGKADSLELNLGVENKSGIKTWSVNILGADGSVVFPMVAASTEPVPEIIYWDGRNTAGAISEGTYKASFSVEYEKGNLVQKTTLNEFTLDTTPPAVKLSLKPLPFSPDMDGENDKLAIITSAEDSSGVEKQTLQIFDSRGTFFTSFPVKKLNESILWDGFSQKGELVQSAEDYVAVYTACDTVGNCSRIESALPVDILVLKEGDRLKISIANIHFKPYTAEYMKFDKNLERKNTQTLDRLAQILKKYSQYKISVEGHAVAVFWERPEKAEEEELEVLQPLSLERAEVIKKALTDRGILADRMTVKGYGGMLPIVSHGDLVNRWKNRRVEFILIKQ